MLQYSATLRGGAVVARRAHNPKVEGSNPSPATSWGRSPGQRGFAPSATCVWRRSSVVEQAAHNRRVTGSNPVAAIASPTQTQGVGDFVSQAKEIRP